MFKEHVCAIQAILLSIVEEEDCGSTGSLDWLRQVLDHLQKRHDGHTVVCSTWCCRHGIIMGREENTIRFNDRRVGAIYLDQDVGPFEVYRAFTSVIRRIGGKVIRQVDIVLRSNYRTQSRE